MTKQECMLCGAPLGVSGAEGTAECTLCHKKVSGAAVCENGHFVCDECHGSGIDSIIAACLQETGRDPVVILRKLMALPFCRMHGPEHHIMVGSALLTAYRNAGGELDLTAALIEMQSRGRKVPGGVCGFWGSCGAGISTGMFLSVVTGASPLAGRIWAQVNRMTARSLTAISAHDGPRCCKRNAYLAITEAVGYVRELFGIELELQEIRCIHSAQNDHCIGERCPFN